MNTAAKQRPCRAPLMMALEPRIMFDAAAVATAEAAQAPHADAAPTAVTQSHDVVFVDARVKDPDTLLHDTRPGTEVVRLDANSDGLQQIADYLSQHPGAGSAQIITEGSAGDLWLGNTYLSAENIADHATTLAQLGGGLQTGGDILIYSCNTAADARGVDFVSSLAQLTGRDVAASSNRTGASGDWNLEIATGTIEAAAVLSPVSESSYAFDLATFTVTSNGDNGAGTLRQAIVDAVNGDTITFNSSMTISLTTVTSGNMLAINENLTIDGDLNNDGTPDVTLDAQNRGRVLAVTAGTVTLDGLVLTNGLVSGNGGGFGSLAGGDAMGAGIGVSGAGTKVTILHSTITANAAAGGGGGGSGSGYNYGGGGGGGRAGIGGGSGGAYNGFTAGSSGGSGTGGTGGHAGTVAQAGKGGSTTGGAGGSVTVGFVAGGSGAAAGPGGGSSIGGGGGGAGASGGATGGRGGHAAGGMYVGSGATIYMATSTVSSNWGAGGGGGGGYYSAGGAGGDGAGAIRVVGTLKYQSSSMTFSSNSGVGATGGGSNYTGGSNGNSTTNIRSAGGTVDSNWAPPNTSPTLGTVTANAVGQANAGQNSYSFTVVYSDSDGTIDNTTIDTNDVTVSRGGTNLTASNATWNAGSSTATYTVTPAGGTWDDADNGTWTIAIVANQVADDAGAFVAANAGAGSFAVSMDTTGSTVSSVSSSTANGGYKAGDTIAVTVQFDEAVTVTGTPTLALNSGGAASYASGSGTNTLTFNYTIQNAENSSDLDYSATNSLSLSGGTIRDAASNNATLTLPAVGGGSSLGGQKNIVVDTAAPAVSSVSATTANGTYRVGDTIAVTVTFAEAVTVTGTPTLTLNSGGSASYASGSGTNTLTFNYSIGAGDSAADLDYSATNSLALSGGTVRDAVGNNATLTLPTVGGGSSLGGQKNIVVDGIAPSLQSDTVPADATYGAGQNLDFTVTYSEAVTVNTGGGTPYIGVTLNTGGAVQAAYLSGSGTTTLTFRYTVASGNVDADGVAIASSITTNGGTIRDAAGNTAATTGITFAATAGVLVEAVAPTVASINRVTSATTNATSVDYTVTFSENVSGVDTSDFTLTTTGTAAGSVASVAQVSGSTYTVTVDTISGNGTLRLDLKNAGTGISDTPGNAIGSGFTSGQTYTIDNTAPAVTSVGVPANATYIAGQNLDFTVNFDSAVTVDTGGGTPRIAITLDTGGTVYANYLSGSGTGALVFRYTVASGNADSNGIAVAGSFDANGGTLRDTAGNNAAATLNSVGSTASVLVDAVVPTVSSVSVPANGTYIAAQNLDFTVNFSENVTVDTGGGTPRVALTLDTGGTVYASYLSGSGTGALVFRYTVAGGNLDADGIGVGGSIDANGGTLRDGIGNDATLTLNSVGSTSSVLVDAVAPGVASIDRVTGSLTNATSVDYTVTFSENVSGIDAADFALTATGTASGTIASVAAIDGSTYTVTVDTVSGDGTLRLDLKNAGTGIGDTSGNAIGGGFTSGQTYTFDHTAPTVTSVGVPANATYIAGQNLDFTVSVSENATVDTGGGLPRIALTLDTGGTVYANYVSGSGTSVLTFRYTVASGNLDTSGIALGGSVDANGGTLRDAAGNDIDTTLNGVGSTAGVLVDGIAPSVASISRAGTPPGNASSADYTVTFSENVSGVDIADFTLTATGTASGTIAAVNAVSGSTYTVTVNGIAGDGTLRLDFNNTGTGISDASGNAISGGFTSGQAYTFDHTAPTVSSPGAPADATYIAGQNLDFTVTYSEAVTVDVGGGTPYLAVALDAGGSVQATYISGSGTAALTFRYTIATGNVDGNGVAAASSITLNGGIISDSAGNDAATTGIGFGSTASVLVDGAAPSVASIDRAGSATTNATGVDYTVTFSEDVSGVDVSGFALTATGTASGSIASVSPLSGSVYTVTVNTLAGDGTLRLDLKNIGTGITDTPGNAIGSGFSSGQTYTIDNTPPTVGTVGVPANGTYVAGQNLDFTVDFDSAVTVDTGGGTPRLALTLDTGGTVYANYLSGSGTSTLVFRYTAASGNADSNGIAVASSFDANGGTLRDTAGNEAASTLNGVGSTASVLVDGIAPSVASIDRVGPSPSNAGSANYTVAFSESVSGVGISDFTLAATGTASATIAAVTALDAQTYRVTVDDVAGDGTLRLDLRNAGTDIADAAGNSIAAGFNAGESFSFDHSAPQIASVGVPAAGTYVEGGRLDFTVTFSETVMVDTASGAPRIALDFDSGGAHFATYLAGSGTNVVTFRYDVARADQDVTGVGLSSGIDLNGGRILDGAGNDSAITFANVGATDAVKIGGVPPTIALPPAPESPAPSPVVEIGALSSATPAVLTAFSSGPASSPELFTAQVSATLAPLDNSGGSPSYSPLSAPDSIGVPAPASRYVGIDSAPAGATVLHAGIPGAQLAVSEQTSFSFALPPGTFICGPDSSITVEARLLNGQPLPSWLRFDPATGTFEGTPPRGWRQPLTIVLTARDQDGHEAVVRIRVQVEREQAQIRTTPIADVREHVPWDTHARPSGKASLAEQFAEHGQSAWHRTLDALTQRAAVASETHSPVEESA